MSKISNDTLAGLVLLVYSLIHIFYITPNQVELHLNDTVLALSPRLFCYITGGLLSGLSAILLIQSIRKNGRGKTEETAEPTSWQPLMRGLFSAAMACAYVALASLLGFFAATALAMTVFLIYFGVRRWSGILLFLFVVLGFIYLLFVKALKVVMPDGLLF